MIPVFPWSLLPLLDSFLFLSQVPFPDPCRVLSLDPWLQVPVIQVSIDRQTAGSQEYQVTNTTRELLSRQQPPEAVPLRYPDTWLIPAVCNITPSEVLPAYKSKINHCPIVIHSGHSDHGVECWSWFQFFNRQTNSRISRIPSDKHHKGTFVSTAAAGGGTAAIPWYLINPGCVQHNSFWGPTSLQI